MTQSRAEILVTARDREIKRLRNETNKLKKSLGGLGPAAKIAGGAIAAIGFARLASSIVGTIRQFEDLRATLVTIEGDAQKAAKSFQLIQDFTAGTPFQLADVTQAFITFRNAGLLPTTEFMTNVGNIAAGMGQRIDSVARAVFNATTGEFEMLKQLGIKVKTEGDKLTVLFKGTSQTIANDGRAIIGVINEIGRSDFAGGIDRQAKTLTGAISNVKDDLRFLLPCHSSGTPSRVPTIYIVSSPSKTFSAVRRGSSFIQIYPVAAPLTSGMSANSENITVPFESANSNTMEELVANKG